MGKKVLVLGLFIFLLLGLLWGTSIPMASGSQELDRVIRVYGEAEIAVEPDVARIQLAVETRSQSAEKAASENAVLMRAVLSALEGIGLADEQIATGRYTIYSYREFPEPGRAPDQEEVTWYRATNEVNITLEDLEKTGLVIDTAVKAGANQVRSIHFDLKDAESLQLEALKIATRQAGTKARAIAQGAGVTIREIRSISEDLVFYAPFRADYGEFVMMEMDPSAPPTPITPGEVIVRARVMAEYSF